MGREGGLGMNGAVAPDAGSAGVAARIRQLQWARRLITLLALTGILICLMDVLAAAIRNSVYQKYGNWWGASQISPWQRSGGAGSLLWPASLRLLITISDDKLTAHYRFTASGDQGRAARALALAGQRAETGDILVDNLLGLVVVGQFRGLTGNNHYGIPLRFRPPRMQVTGGRTTVSIDSMPFRLLLSQQFLRVLPPVGTGEDSPEDLRVIDSSGIQVLDVTGAWRTKAADNEIDLHLPSRAVTVAAVVREPGQGWMTGLRATGGMIIPFPGGLLLRLGSLFIYFVLLWSLARARLALPASRRVAVARNAVLTVVCGLAALAVLGFCYELTFTLIHSPVLQGPVQAGPLGLLMAGIVVLWPAACWRVTPADPLPPPGEQAPSVKDALRPTGWQWFAMALAGFAYLAALWWLDVSPSTNWWLLLPGTAGTVILACLLVNALLSRNDKRGPVPLLATFGMLAAVLGATVGWPLLLFPGIRFPGSAPQVNVIGKWTYLVAGVIVAIGLCVMAARVIWVLTGKHIWRWAASSVITLVTLVAVVPSLWTQAQVDDPHAAGLVAWSLFDSRGLYGALLELLTWLLLGLAVAVLLSARRELRGPSEIRCLTYRLAIPVMTLLLYGNGIWHYNAWLYVPVTFIAGLMLLVWLVLPKRLASASANAHTPAQAIELSLDAWRSAEFAADQRQQLVTSGDDMRAILINKGAESYKSKLAALASAQNGLARLHDRWEEKARVRMAEAFDHRGELPDRCTARIGAVIGALLGLIPLSVTLLFAQPPAGPNGYPIPDFLGSTGWNMLGWSALGWSIGYFLPFLRGRNGIEKALWIFVAYVGAWLPITVLLSDGRDWSGALIFYLELFSFLIIVSVVLCDLVTLQSASKRAYTWIQVHNWRFIVTWSAALLAAIGTVVVTFATTTAADIGHQTVIELIRPPAPPSVSQKQQ